MPGRLVMRNLLPSVGKKERIKNHICQEACQTWGYKCQCLIKKAMTCVFSTDENCMSFRQSVRQSNPDSVSSSNILLNRTAPPHLVPLARYQVEAPQLDELLWSLYSDNTTSVKCRTTILNGQSVQPGWSST